MPSISELLDRMYSDIQAGQTQKEKMFGKSIASLESYADMFRAGGAYGEGVEAMIGRGKKRAVAGGMQSLVSAGLAGTTRPMQLEQTYEEEIGMPTRMRAEDVRTERLGGILGSLGQMYASYDPGVGDMGEVGRLAVSQGEIESRERMAQEERESRELRTIYTRQPTRQPYVSTMERMATWKAGRPSQRGPTGLGGSVTTRRGPTGLGSSHRSGFTNPYS